MKKLVVAAMVAGLALGSPLATVSMAQDITEDITGAQALDLLSGATTVTVEPVQGEPTFAETDLEALRATAKANQFAVSALQSANATPEQIVGIKASEDGSVVLYVAAS